MTSWQSMNHYVGYTQSIQEPVDILSHDFVSFLADGGCGTGWVNVYSGGFILAGSGL